MSGDRPVRPNLSTGHVASSAAHVGQATPADAPYGS